MNIITCFKVVPEEQDITIKPNGELSFENAKMTISNYDLNSIEAGAQLIESISGTLIGLSVGALNIDDSKLKKNVLSRGPESLYLLADDNLVNMDTHQTAMALKAAVEKIGDYDLILCGEGSADLYAQQVGAQLGELLNVPTINSISKITASEGKVVVERTLEEEVETIELALPAVVSVTSDINLPRIASMKQILAAGKRPSNIWNINEVNLSKPEKTIEVLESKAPPQVDRKQDIIEGDSEEIIQKFIEKISKELK